MKFEWVSFVMIPDRDQILGSFLFVVPVRLLESHFTSVGTPT
ncbi:hypothetical protein ACQV5M_04975 [Leptospira sp. SA-E8]